MNCLPTPARVYDPVSLGVTMDRVQAARVLEKLRNHLIDCLTVVHLAVKLPRLEEADADRERKKRREIEQEIEALDIALDALWGIGPKEKGAR